MRPGSNAPLSVGFLETDLRTAFATITQEFQKAVRRIEKEAKEARELPIPEPEDEGSPIGPFFGFLIGIAIFLLLGIFLIWPIYCFLRKRKEKEDEEGEAIVPMEEKPSLDVLSPADSPVEPAKPSPGEPQKPPQPVEAMTPVRRPQTPRNRPVNRPRPVETQKLPPTLSPIGLSPMRRRSPPGDKF